MKKIYLLLLLPLLLSGCTLFEEDYDQVPHHTGEGYDKPVTETVSGVEMTYQFNDNVRLLDEKEQQQIAYVEADETNLFMQVDFKDDTPENLLPKKGEILVSKATSLFPYGASHHVRSVKRVDGKYRCLLEYAKLDETFKELDIDGQLTYDDVNQDEYYVATRAGSSEEYVEEGFSFSGSTVSFKLPIPFGYSGTKDGAYWSIDMKAEKNYVKVSTEFNFDKFSIRNGNYNIDVVETEPAVHAYGIAEFGEGLQIGRLIAQASGRFQRFGKECAADALAASAFVHIELYYLAPALGQSLCGINAAGTEDDASFLCHPKHGAGLVAEHLVLVVGGFLVVDGVLFGHIQLVKDVPDDAGYSFVVLLPYPAYCHISYSMCIWLQR